MAKQYSPVQTFAKAGIADLLAAAVCWQRSGCRTGLRFPQ